MHDFLIAFLGGLMLGVSVVGYLYVHGRIAGISGLIGQVLNPKMMFKTSAIWFMAGLITVPFIYGLFVQPEIELNASPLMLVVAVLRRLALAPCCSQAASLRLKRSLLCA